MAAPFLAAGAILGIYVVEEFLPGYLWQKFGRNPINELYNRAKESLEREREERERLERERKERRRLEREREELERLKGERLKWNEVQIEDVFDVSESVSALIREHEKVQEREGHEQKIRNLEGKNLHLRNEILEQRNNLKSSQDKVQELEQMKKEFEEKRKQEKIRHEEKIRDLEEINLHLQNEILEQRKNLKSSQDKVQELEQMKKEFEEKRKQEKKNATELDRYEKEDGGRGICFLINNFNFPDGRERRGAENDEKTMVDLFRNEIRFEVEVLQNLNGSEILKSAKYIAKRDFTQYTQFVFIIMSHGDKDAIEGVDGALVKVAQLMSQFSVRECETLRNKPKLFFIQACRGKLSDPRKDRLPTSLESTEGDGITRMLYPDSSLADGVTPLEADFLLSFATVPGHQSWRSQVRGSWYIQKLADVIRKNRHDHDLLEMLTEVNKQVAGIANEYPEFDLSFQVPAHSSTLRAKVFLS